MRKLRTSWADSSSTRHHHHQILPLHGKTHRQIYRSGFSFRGISRPFPFPCQSVDRYAPLIALFNEYRIPFMDSVLQPRIDIWTEVLSYISEPRDIANWHGVSKTAQSILHLCHSNVSVSSRRREDWFCVAEWLCSLQRISSLEIHMSNCTFDLMRPLIISTSQCTEATPTMNLAITKCFSMGDNIVSALSICRRAALCDINFKNAYLKPDQCRYLQVLILSNCIFGPLQTTNPEKSSALSPLWSDFPESLTFLGLGGSSVLSSPTVDATRNDTCLRSNIVVDVSFLNDTDVKFVHKFFPNARKIDFSRDCCTYLDECLRFGGVANKPLLKSALLTCSNAYNQTPLHLACWAAQAERILWLLKNGAKADLKDTRGCTPLHRAADPYRRDNEAPVDSDVLLSVSIRALMEACPYSCISRNQTYDTPIYIAALKGNAAVLRAMLSFMEHARYYSVELTSFSQPIDRKPVGGYRCEYVKFDSTCVTATTAANATAVDHSECTRSECKLISAEFSLDNRCGDDRGFSPLHAAVINRNLECCQLLLHKDWCCPKRVNIHGSTPLRLAYRYQDMDDIIALLYKRSGTLDFDRSWEQEGGKQKKKCTLKKSRQRRKSRDT